MSLNTNHTCKADFRKDTEQQDIALWITPKYKDRGNNIQVLNRFFIRVHDEWFHNVQNVFSKLNSCW